MAKVSLLRQYEKQLIHERDESLRKIEFKYIQYIHSLLFQKVVITEKIRQKYDRLIQQVHDWSTSNSNHHHKETNLHSNTMEQSMTPLSLPSLDIIAPNDMEYNQKQHKSDDIETNYESPQNTETDNVPFVSHMSLQEAQNLSINDQIDHRDSVGCSIESRVVDKKGSNLLIHYNNWSDEWDIWSDYTHELYKYAPYKSISARPRHRFFDLTEGCLIDINPWCHKGWKLGTIVQFDRNSGQIQTSYRFDEYIYYFWAHIDNEEEIAKPFTFTQSKFQCIYCSNVYKSYKELRKHMELGHSERKHLCPFCPWSCKSATDLKVHLSQHNNDYSFKCDLCDALYQSDTAFRTKAALTRHLTRVHYNKNSNTSGNKVSGRKRKGCSSQLMKVQMVQKKRKLKRMNKEMKECVMNCKMWKLWMDRREQIIYINIDKNRKEIKRLIRKELKEWIMNNKLCDEWMAKWDEYSFVCLEQKVFFDLCAARVHDDDDKSVSK